MKLSRRAFFAAVAALAGSAVVSTTPPAVGLLTYETYTVTAIGPITITPPRYIPPGWTVTVYTVEGTTEFKGTQTT